MTPGDRQHKRAFHISKDIMLFSRIFKTILDLRSYFWYVSERASKEDIENTGTSYYI